MPDVAYIRRKLLEGMDLSPYGIFPVQLVPGGKPMWAVTSKVALCLTIDEALSKQGLYATLDSRMPYHPNRLYIESRMYASSDPTTLKGTKR